MRKKMIGRCALMLLIAALMLSCLPAFAAAEPAQDGTANENVGALDLTKPCSVTLHLSGNTSAVTTDTTQAASSETIDEEVRQELANTEVLVDVYKVADAVEVKGYDAYTFEAVAPFDSLKILDDMGKSDAEELASKAKDIAIDNDPLMPVTKEVGEENVTINGLEAGLYLILLHTEGDPALTVNSTRLTFKFNPILVSLPTKSSTDTGVVMTSDTGEWSYDAEVYLKPDYGYKLGCFEIEKTFEGLVDDGVTVIFDVSVTLNGEPYEKCNNVYSMYFPDHNQSTGKLLVTGIPVGAVVTVNEVYCSGGYGCIRWDNTILTITKMGDTEEESSGTASFTNARDEYFYIPGGSVENTYTSVNSEIKGEYSWQVEQRAGDYITPTTH